VRVEQGRRLPPEDLELPTTAPTGRSERVRPRLRADPGGSKHLGRELCGEAEPDDDPGKDAARQATGPNVRDQTVDMSIVHEVVLLPVAVGRPVGGRVLPPPGLLVGEDSRGPARSAYYSKRPSGSKSATTLRGYTFSDFVVTTVALGGQGCKAS
jgi:hypothetical protein